MGSRSPGPNLAPVHSPWHCGRAKNTSQTQKPLTFKDWKCPRGVREGNTPLHPSTLLVCVLFNLMHARGRHFYNDSCDVISSHPGDSVLPSSCSCLVQGQTILIFVKPHFQRYVFCGLGVWYRPMIPALSTGNE